MRSIRLWVVAVVAFSSVAMAQTESLSAPPGPPQVSPRTTIISVSPQIALTSLLGASSQLEVSAEHAMSQRWSWALGLSANALGLLSSTGLTLEAQLRPEAHYFLWGAAPSGLWVGPQLSLGVDMTRYTSLIGNTDGTVGALHTTSVGTTFGAALLIGFNLVLPYGLSLSASTGPALAFRSVDQHTEGDLSSVGLGAGLAPITAPEGTTVALEANFAVGYAF